MGSPEVRHIAADGTIRIYHFSAAYQPVVRQWAEAEQVPISEDVRPDLS